MARGQDTGNHPNRKVGFSHLMQRIGDAASVPGAWAVNKLLGENSSVRAVPNAEYRQIQQNSAAAGRSSLFPPTASGLQPPPRPGTTGSSSDTTDSSSDSGLQPPPRPF